MANMSEDVGSTVVRMDAIGREKEEVAAEEVLEVLEVRDNFQQLLQLLKGKSEAWSEAGKSFGAITVHLAQNSILYHENDLLHAKIQSWLFDKADSSYESFQEWTLEVGSEEMCRLMRRIGKSRTIRQISINVLKHESGYYKMSELKALLSPLHSNPVLDSLTIEAYLFPDTEHRIYEILGRILQISATLKSLRLDLSRSMYMYEGTAKDLRAYHLLASGLQGNDTSSLENFSLRCPGTLTASEVKQVAEMVLSAPRLSDLRLIRLSYLRDDDGIDALANALAVKTSLKSLWLEDVFDGASALLRETFTGESSCTNRIGNSLLLLLSSNQYLKDLQWDLRDNSMDSVYFDWQSLGQFFSSNSSLECFRILLPCSSDSLYSVKNLLKGVDKIKACVELYVIDSKNSRAWYSAAQWRPRDEEREDVLSDMKKLVLELHLYNFWAFYEVLPDLGRELNAL